MNDLQELLEALNLSGKLLDQLIASIPHQLYDVRRRQNFWTIAEQLNHLADVQPMLLERIKKFQEEDNPYFVPYIPKDEDIKKDSKSINIKNTLNKFKSLRKKQIELLKSMDSKAWEKNATHPEYQQYSLHILVRHILMHDYWHMYRIEELWLTKDQYLTTLE
jgi:uncharacterized damage-inducible protein DinB